MVMLLALLGTIWHLICSVAKKEKLNTQAFGLILATLTMIWFVVFPSFIPNEPGIRRSTGFLVGYYTVISILAASLWSKSFPSLRTSIQPAIAWILVSFLLVGNGLTFWNNLSDYQTIADRNNEAWVMTRGNPRDSLEFMYREAEAGKPITCKHFGKECRFAVRFAYIRSLQKWNSRKEFPIQGIDPRNQEVKDLSMKIWEQREWPH